VLATEKGGQYCDNVGVGVGALVGLVGAGEGLKLGAEGVGVGAGVGDPGVYVGESEGAAVGGNEVGDAVGVNVASLKEPSMPVRPTVPEHVSAS
jgi:hypothetical protein